jgi:hypothetical protein
MGAWKRLLGRLGFLVAVFVAAYLGGTLGWLGTREVRASHNFADVPDGYFAHDFVDFLVDNGLTAGCGGGNFCPEQPVTRGQEAVFLKKFLEVGSMPQVVDATGRLVGRMVTVFESGAQVALVVQGRLVFVTVGPNGFQVPSLPAINPFYLNDQCTGQGFVRATNVVPTFATAIQSVVRAPGHMVSASGSSGRRPGSRSVRSQCPQHSVVRGALVVGRGLTTSQRRTRCDSTGSGRGHSACWWPWDGSE